ncbi:hypothetical protein NPIL_308371 [Nephila pilipes]|uniref:Uncharacterized protein n=1 Tax=Nephila pilipes TaxID=299642 RepID=A0A8X6TMF0_NEPPI|nr:hypothetical protein NPIL_308371 [Nephila pilipes]
MPIEIYFGEFNDKQVCFGHRIQINFCTIPTTTKVTASMSRSDKIFPPPHPGTISGGLQRFADADYRKQGHVYRAPSGPARNRRTSSRVTSVCGCRSGVWMMGLVWFDDRVKMSTGTDGVDFVVRWCWTVHRYKHLLMASGQRGRWDQFVVHLSPGFSRFFLDVRIGQHQGPPAKRSDRTGSP